MKKVLLFIFVIGLAVPAAWAQDDISVKQVDANSKKNMEGNPNTLSAKDLFTEYASVSSISNLMQAAADANNVAHINIVGNKNTARISQKGLNIVGAININGFNNNNISLNQGMGSGASSNLLSLITIEGDGNELSMDQNGNDLGNLVQVQGANMSIGLEQDNSGFRYFQDGRNANPIQITSTSNYVPIIIRNNQ